MAASEFDPDSELIAGLKRGGRASFERLMDRYETRVYNLALRMLDGRPAEAEDAAQDIFLEIHRSFPKFQEQSRLDTWIHRIAVNVCLQRRRRRSLPTVGLLEADGCAAPDGDPLRMAEHAELRQVMARAVGRLPEAQRDVVLLHGMQGLTYAEVAEVLACPVGTVKSRLSGAFRRLRELLGPYVHSELGEARLSPLESGK